MKSKQNLTGTTRQKSIIKRDVSQSSAAKSVKSRLVVGPSLMTAIKNCVRPVGVQ